MHNRDIIEVGMEFVTKPFMMRMKLPIYKLLTDAAGTDPPNPGEINACYTIYTK